MKIFVTNAGSSSLKFQVFNMPEETVAASGGIERIGDEEGFAELKINGEKKRFDVLLKNHTEAVNYAVKLLIDNKIIKSTKDISAVGHRVVHGANNTATLKIDKTFLKQEEVLTDIAPLHTPGAFMGIKACESVFGKENYAVFDTAFHQTMPEKAYMYAIKLDDAQNFGVRKYGFHGMSHKFVCDEAKKQFGSKKIISCHLGNGASISAVKNGECLDTTMGFTPLEGLMMGTRSGDIDPSAVLFLAEKKGLSHKEAITYLTKECGVKGVFGKNDMRDVEVELKTNPRARLAFEMFCYRVTKYIGSYAAVLNGVDTIIFTAGIGERGEMFREEICKNLSYLGAELDLNQNIKLNRAGGVISKKSSKVKIVIIPTNEELVIAREVYAKFKNKKTAVLTASISVIH